MTNLVNVTNPDGSSLLVTVGAGVVSITNTTSAGVATTQTFNLPATCVAIANQCSNATYAAFFNQLSNVLGEAG